VTYVLERSTNGGAFAPIFTGTAHTFTDTVAAGLTSVQYRVRARNTAGLYSAFATSAVITVFTNFPPEIIGSDEYLGEKTEAFEYVYTVTDPDAGQLINIKECLNGVMFNEIVAESGLAHTLIVDQDRFVLLPNATTASPHTLTIVATDPWGETDTRTLTFSKNEYRIEIMKIEPHQSETRPTRAIITVGREIPDGAIFQVLITNNALDDIPYWEDATESVLAGVPYVFNNTQLDNLLNIWGVSVQVSVNRNGVDGLCYISSIGGNFE